MSVEQQQIGQDSRSIAERVIELTKQQGTWVELAEQADIPQLPEASED